MTENAGFRVRRADHVGFAIASLDEAIRFWVDDLGAVQHGSKPFARLDAKGVRLLRDELAEHPGAANNLLKAIKALFSWAVEAQEAQANPARETYASYAITPPGIIHGPLRR